MAGSDFDREIKGTLYHFKDSQMRFLQELSDRVQKMRTVGKLTPEVLGHIRRYFRIKNIYHSNAIEGNVLDVGETRQVVEQGLTITGKPLRDQAEARNLKEAMDFMEDLVVSADAPITEVDIRQIHYLVLKDSNNSNAGKYRSVSVEISGSAFRPPSPEKVQPEMREFGKWLSSIPPVNGNYGSLDAILYAAAAHTWFVYIHPFIDGNGRVARLLMNLMLMRYGYPIAIIAKEDRLRYYEALEDSQSSDLSPFITLVMECIEESLEEYEEAGNEQRRQEEWAAAVASRFSKQEAIQVKNEYEVWKSAMELLRGHFRQSVALLNNQEYNRIRYYLKEFGALEYEKYASLRSGGSAKRTWFFRTDFVGGERTARYLFFFGAPSRNIRTGRDRASVAVTLHLAREEPPGSHRFERLEQLTAPNIPDIAEIGYHAKSERFVYRKRSGPSKAEKKIETIGRFFFEQVISLHFQN